MAHTDDKRTPLMGQALAEARNHKARTHPELSWEWSRAAGGDHRRGRRQMVPRNEKFLVVCGKCDGSQETLQERTSRMVQTLELSSGLFHCKVSRFVSAGSLEGRLGLGTRCHPSMRCWRTLGTSCRVIAQVCWIVWKISCVHPLSIKKIKKVVIGHDVKCNLLIGWISGDTFLTSYKMKRSNSVARQ